MADLFFWVLVGVSLPLSALLMYGIWSQEQTRHRQLRARLRRLEMTQDAYILAENRARDLFYSLLSKKQVEEFHEKQLITVVGSKGGIYRIAYGYSGNIFKLVDPSQPRVTVQRCNCLECQKEFAKGDIECVYCAHLPNDMEFFPYFDHMVAQLLLIRTDEPRFLKTAF